MLTMDATQRLAREWLEAWNSHDLDRIISHYARDIRFTSPFVARITGREDGTLQGLEALREYIRRALAAYPELHFTGMEASSGVQSVVLNYRSVNNLSAAEFMQLDDNGKICRVVAHYRPGG